MKELGEFFGGSTPSTADPTLWGGDIHWLVPSEISGIQEYQTHLYQTENRLTQKGYRSCSTQLLPPGTVAVSSRATIGDCIIFGREICTNQGFINIVCNERTNNLFLLYWLRQNKRELLRFAAGTTFDEIGRGTFKKLEVIHPIDPKQQQSIGEAILAVDSTVAATRDSIAKAERLQKGLMQQLLSGRLKPDGTPRNESDFDSDERLGLFPKGWKVRKLRQVVKLKNGKSNITSSLRNNADAIFCYPVFGGNGMTGWSDRYLLESPTVVLGRVGEYCGVVHRTPPKAWVTDNALYASEFPEPIDLAFLFYLLVHLRLNRWKAITGQPKITQGEILNIRVAIPEDTDEQAAIAARLDGLRQLIEAKQAKVSALQRLKKSFMQNLLTGRIRLPAAGAAEAKP